MNKAGWKEEYNTGRVVSCLYCGLDFPDHACKQCHFEMVKESCWRHEGYCSKECLDSIHAGFSKKKSFEEKISLECQFLKNVDVISNNVTKDWIDCASRCFWEPIKNDDEYKKFCFPKETTRRLEYYSGWFRRIHAEASDGQNIRDNELLTLYGIGLAVELKNLLKDDRLVFIFMRPSKHLF